MTPKKNELRLGRASLLALALAALGNPAGNLPARDAQPEVTAQVPQPPSTHATPTLAQSQASIAAAIRGGSGSGGRAFNPIRRARRRLERLGIITSGRQWRNFRKYTRHNAIVAEFWAATLRGEV